MKAAVLYRPHDIIVEEVPRPTAQPGQVVVNVKATAVCGTDVGIYTGKIFVPGLPVIQGHESTGEVVEVGRDVTDFQVGDPVVLNSLIFCRHCAYCYAGKVNLCPNGGLMGREVDGTFAEYVAVPDYNCIKIPDAISCEDGTSLIALATVFRSHEKIRITPGETVAVIGQGAAGLLQTRLSVISGAEPVFAIARSQWKLDIAKEYGATVINAGKVKLTGQKMKKKIYRYHTLFPGGLKETTAEKLLAHDPDRLVRHAVWGMIPKGRLGRRIIKKLKVYAGPEHLHAAQQPQKLDL